MGGRRHSAARLVGLAIVSFAALLFLHGEHVHHELHGTVFDAGGKMDKSGWLSDAGGAGIREGGGRPLANDLKQLGQDGNDQGIGPATTPSTRTNAEEAQSRAVPTDGAEQVAPQSRPRLPTDGAELALLVLCMPSPVDPRGRAGRIDVIETTWALDVRRRGGDVRYGVPLGGAVPAQHADKYLAPVGVPNGTDTADKFAEMRGLLAAALQAHPTGLRWLFCAWLRRLPRHRYYCGSYYYYYYYYYYYTRADCLPPLTPPLKTATTTLSSFRRISGAT
jgi:hypothetical protein